MRVPLLALALTGFAGLAGGAGAQAHPPGHTGPMNGQAHPPGHAGPVKAQAAKPAGKFIHAGDKNKDQRIDPAEWAAIGEPRANFAKADKNRDGKLDGAEFVAWKYPNMTRRP